MDKKNVMNLTAAEDNDQGNTMPAADDAERDGENELVVKFGKPYVYEGQEYTELDLSGLESVNAATLSSVGRAVSKKNPGLNTASLEMTMEYALLMAQRVTKKPVEFFERMPGKEAVKLKGVVVGFLFGGDGDN